MLHDEDAVIVNGIKITTELINALNNFVENDPADQQRIVVKSSLHIAGLAHPDHLPIEPEFFLIQERLNELLGSIVQSKLCLVQ